VPSADLPFFLPAMKQYRETPSRWFGSVTPLEVRKMARRLREEGPLSIRDIGDDELVDKDHPWASRKPSKRVLEMMFFQGLVTIGTRQGMVKTYDLTARHFGWDKGAQAGPPTGRSPLTCSTGPCAAGHGQSRFGLPSRCAAQKGGARTDRKPRAARLLVPVHIEGQDKAEHWPRPKRWLASGSRRPG
jgi:hypothetical protein